MDNLDNQTEEALGWAAEGKKLAVDVPEVSFKDAATFVASMTPIIGDAVAAKEVYDELQKDEPNYYLAGALGGAALIGIIPGLGDVAAKAIKKGAKEVFDVSSNIPKVSRKGTPSYTDSELLEADEIISEWGKGNLSNPELRSKLSDKGFTIETKRISPKMTGDDLEVVGPDGNIVRWKDMPRGSIDRGADAAITKDDKARLFNEGGAVMNSRDNQMEMLFDEGGISDDGMNVDPVSGNEIPPGSMASEVRDDIPAQLSEGEYVVPADVTRFFGVKFFEDLRAEAKRGLMDMEANGRIGGEPVGMEDPRGDGEALTPEEMAVLQEMGMAVGGFVPQPTQSTDPYMQQQQMYQQPSPVAMGNTGYAEGGLEDGTAPEITQPTFDPSMYGAGFSFLSPSTPQEPTVTTVMLYSPDGLTTQSFSLPAQQTDYDAKIAEGWSTTQVQTPQVTTKAGDNDDPPIKPDTGEQGKKFSEMTPDELKEAYSKNLKARTLMEGMALINPMLGLAGIGATKYAETQILKNMKDKKVAIPDPEEEGGILAGITNWFSETFGTKKDKEPTLLKGRDLSITPAGATTASAMSQAQVKAGIDYAAKGDDRDTSWQGGKVWENQSKPESNDNDSPEQAAAKSQAKAEAAAKKLGVPLATGGKAEGGLMQKKKKK